MAKVVVGLLSGEVVSTKKTHIVAKDVVGLPVGDSKNNKEFIRSAKQDDNYGASNIVLPCPGS